MIGKQQEHNNDRNDEPEEEQIRNTYKRQIKSYVLRAGRMSKGQQRAYDELHDQFCIPYSEQMLDISRIFARTADVIMDIGFGMGESTAFYGQNYRDNNILGVEVHKPGVGKLLSEIRRLELTNIRIIQQDVKQVLRDMVPSGSLQGIHIYFPDPWPKKKHHKRRLVQDDFIGLCVIKLKQGGYIHCATDWEEYSEQMLEVLSGNSSLYNSVEDSDGGGFAPKPSWRPDTRFEEKGIRKSHIIRDLLFRKKNT